MACGIPILFIQRTLCIVIASRSFARWFVCLVGWLAGWLVVGRRSGLLGGYGWMDGCRKQSNIFTNSYSSPHIHIFTQVHIHTSIQAYICTDPIPIHSLSKCTLSKQNCIKTEYKYFKNETNIFAFLIVITCKWCDNLPHKYGTSL